MGLMERRQLAPDAGMLFMYDSSQAPTAGFWMFRTHFNHSKAFGHEICGNGDGHIIDGTYSIEFQG